MSPIQVKPTWVNHCVFQILRGERKKKCLSPRPHGNKHLLIMSQMPKNDKIIKKQI